MTVTETAIPTKTELDNESTTDRMIREKMQKNNSTADKNKTKDADGAGPGTSENPNPEDIESNDSAEALELKRRESLTDDQREMEDKLSEKEKAEAAELQRKEAEKNKGKSPEAIEAETRKNKSRKSKQKELEVPIHSIYTEESPAADGKDKEKNKNNEDVAPEIKQKVALADEVMEDPFLKGYLEVKKSGGNINEYLSSTHQVDYAKMTAEEIITLDCKNRGITEPKDIQLEIDAFDDLTPRKKDIELSEIKTSLKAKDEKRKTQLGLDLGASAKREKAIVQRFTSEVPELIDGLIGKPIEGHKELTKSDAELLKKAMLNPRFQRPDGTFNTAYLAQLHARALFYEGDLKTAKADGWSDGFDAAMEEVSRPSKDGTAGRSSSQQKVKTKAEEIREGIGKEQ